MMKTTLHTVLCVTIRLGAVLMAVGIVQQAPTIFLYPSQGGQVAVGALLLAGAGLLAAFALWLWPNILAWWAISRNQHEVLESTIDAEQFQHIAFSVVGVWLFISGTCGCLARVTMMLIIFRRSAYGDSTMVLSASDWFWLVEHLAITLAGAWLALGSRGLIGLLHRLRGHSQFSHVETDADTVIAEER
jgi:hypothetical protein